MKRFRVYWLDGKTEEIEGVDIADAFLKAGIGNGALPAVDYYEEISQIPEINDVSMSNPTISFSWEGQYYIVDMSAYKNNRIKLPSGEVLEAAEWLESYPPWPGGLHLASDQESGATLAVPVPSLFG